LNLAARKTSGYQLQFFQSAKSDAIFTLNQLSISDLRLSRFMIAIYRGEKGIDVSILSRTSFREPLNGPVDSILMDVSAAANRSESSTE